MAAAPGLILLTGATGFVGRQILRELGERSCRVRVIVRDAGKIPQSHAIESIVTTPDAFSESAEWWAETCRGADIVIHAAWYATPGDYLQSRKNLECLEGTHRLAEGAVTGKVRRFVGIGTCFEYDVSAGDLSIGTPLNPSTLYAATKASAFSDLSRLFREHGAEFVWCRLFYLYGEGENEKRFVPYLRARLQAGEPAELTSGNQVRDYLDVREAARMVVDAALGSGQGPVNICSGKAITIRQFAERIADEYGRRDLLKFGARPDNLTDPPRVVGVR